MFAFSSVDSALLKVQCDALVDICAVTFAWPLLNVYARLLGGACDAGL